MSIDQYIPDIEELVSSFEAAGYVKEASDLRAMLAAWLPPRPRSRPDPQEVTPTNTKKPFAEHGEEITELTPYGDIAGRAGVLRPSFNKHMTPQEYQSVQHYIDTQAEQGLAGVDQIRQKIMDEQAKYKANPNYEGEDLSYLNEKLLKAKARAEAIRQPVETFKKLRKTLGVDMPEDVYRGDIMQRLTAEYMDPKTDAQRRTLLGQFMKLSEMFKATTMGMLEADQIEKTYTDAMSTQASPDQYRKQLDQLAHLWTHRAAARRLVLAAACLKKMGLETEAGRLKVAAQVLDQNVQIDN